MKLTSEKIDREELDSVYVLIQKEVLTPFQFYLWFKSKFEPVDNSNTTKE
jgi:hypothetical protein